KGVPASLGPWKSLTLFVRSSVPTNTVAAGTPASITWAAGSSGAVMSVGPSTTRAITTDSVSLPTNINIAKLQITCSVFRTNGTAQQVTLNTYEMWVVGTT